MITILTHSSLDLNAAESGVQHKPTNSRGATTITTDQAVNEGKCSC